MDLTPKLDANPIRGIERTKSYKQTILPLRIPSGELKGRPRNRPFRPS